jgi:membrane associated rhomboid family serine protease
LRHEAPVHDDVEALARRTPHRRRAEEWMLVLSAAGIASRIDEAAGEWCVFVSPADAEAAGVALDAFDQEIVEPTPLPAVPEWGPTYAGAVMAVTLVAAYAVTGAADPHGAWYRRGGANASAITDGELWRAVTALTLHVDLTHLVGNVVAIAVFGAGVCRLLGPGLGGWLVLLAGAGGNAANALLRAHGHSSVGASTAVFGAVGILSGLAAARGWAWRRTWMALGAGLALLAMLGTGERADLGAHLFGFLVGGLLGVMAGTIVARPPGRVVQSMLALAAAGVVAACWAVALR